MRQVSALSSTFERKAFGQVMDLVPKCEKVPPSPTLLIDVLAKANLPTFSGQQCMGGPRCVKQLDLLNAVCKFCLKEAAFSARLVCFLCLLWSLLSCTRVDSYVLLFSCAGTRDSRAGIFTVYCLSCLVLVVRNSLGLFCFCPSRIAVLFR